MLSGVGLLVVAFFDPPENFFSRILGFLLIACYPLGLGSGVLGLWKLRDDRRWTYRLQAILGVVINGVVIIWQIIVVFLILSMPPH